MWLNCWRWGREGRKERKGKERKGKERKGKERGDGGWRMGEGRWGLGLVDPGEGSKERD